MYSESATPIFYSLEADRGLGLEALVEDDDPSVFIDQVGKELKTASLVLGDDSLLLIKPEARKWDSVMEIKNSLNQYLGDH